MTHRRAYLLQGVVFLVVGGILLFGPIATHVGEAIVPLTVVFVVSALGFGLAWRDLRRKRETPRRQSSRWYRAGAVSGTAGEKRS